MIAYNFQAGSNEAAGTADEGRWEYAAESPLTARGRIRPTDFRAVAVAPAEQQIIARFAAMGDARQLRLLTALYVGLKTHPFLALTGPFGSGKAGFVQQLAAALVGQRSGQFVRIGSADWAERSGRRGYFRGLHERFGDSRLTEVLHEAAAPSGSGKLFIVLLNGLAPDELYRYAHDLIDLVPRNERPLPAGAERLPLPPNVLVAATLHTPRDPSARDAQVLARAAQVDLSSFALELRGMNDDPPVGLQRAILADAVRDVAAATARLTGILGRGTRLAPSTALTRALWRSGLRIGAAVNQDLLLYAANAFDRFGGGLFDPDARRNAQIAYDTRLVQRVVRRLKPDQQPLRRQLAELVGC
jgi:hypothetical protein